MARGGTPEKSRKDKGEEREDNNRGIGAAAPDADNKNMSTAPEGPNN